VNAIKTIQKNDIVCFNGNSANLGTTAVVLKVYDDGSVLLHSKQGMKNVSGSTDLRALLTPNDFNKVTVVKRKHLEVIIGGL